MYRVYRALSWVFHLRARFWRAMRWNWAADVNVKLAEWADRKALQK